VIGLVILAAGASSRMGRPKALLTVDGATFMARIYLSAGLGGVGHSVIVIGPPDGPQIRRVLRRRGGLLDRRTTSWELAWNAHPERGMLSSVQVGIAALERHRVTHALIWPVDLPLVSDETVRLVIEAEPIDALAAPQYRGRNGHPLRVPRRLFAELMSLPHEQGLRALLQAHEGAIVRVPVEDEGVVRDFDTPDDYERLQREP
jgi:CTP:molybdopterin cytidylyltransferase MocA